MYLYSLSYLWAALFESCTADQESNKPPPLWRLYYLKRSFFFVSQHTNTSDIETGCKNVHNHGITLSITQTYKENHIYQWYIWLDRIISASDIYLSNSFFWGFKISRNYLCILQSLSSDSIPAFIKKYIYFQTFNYIMTGSLYTDDALWNATSLLQLRLPHQTDTLFFSFSSFLALTSSELLFFTRSKQQRLRR